MTQNTSHAVMQQRHEAHDSLDDFPTPPYATRAAIRHAFPLLSGWNGAAGRSVWEPCCNRGYMAKPLGEAYGSVHATDIHDYGWAGQQGTRDFLMPISGPAVTDVVANPPFRLALEFIMRGLDVIQPDGLVAMLVRCAFQEGQERYETLFRPRPPSLIAQFSERVIMAKGRLLDPSRWYWDADAEKWKKPSTATAYCWMIWTHRDAPAAGGAARTMWIPPCRAKLERAGDYPPGGFAKKPNSPPLELEAA